MYYFKFNKHFASRVKMRTMLFCMFNSDNIEVICVSFRKYMDPLTFLFAFNIFKGYQKFKFYRKITLRDGNHKVINILITH